MKQLIRMIDTARKQKFIYVLGVHNEWGKLPLGDFFKHTQNCMPIIFTPKNIVPIDVEREEVVEKLDAPFKIFSIELLGDEQSVTVGLEEDGVKVDTKCIMSVEIEPKTFIHYLLMEKINTNGEVEPIVVLASGGFYNNIVEHFIDRLNSEVVGKKEVVKSFKTDSKNTGIIRKIIYCGPKKQVEESGNHIKVDWSHKWITRGHWRKHNGLGKDRAGIYCVANNTWINEHEKGKGELVIKTRFVKTP